MLMYYTKLHNSVEIWMTVVAFTLSSKWETDIKSYFAIHEGYQDLSQELYNHLLKNLLSSICWIIKQLSYSASQNIVLF